MVEWTDVALVAGGVVAGFVNTLAGAGSALTLPLLMFTGLDASVANGTNRVAVLLQSFAGASTFHAQAVRPWGAAAAALPVIVAGAVIGAVGATHVSPTAMKRLFGVVFLSLAVVMASRPAWLVPNPPLGSEPHPPGPGGHAAFFVVGLYGGVFQAGVGIPLLLVVVRALGTDLVAGNAAKTGLVLVYTLAILGIFGSAGQIAWGPGIMLASGAVVGSIVGARFAVRRGAGFVRRLVMVALVAAGAHALGLF